MIVMPYFSYDDRHARCPVNVREQKKQLSRQKILDAAARRIRVEGVDGAGIAAVMDDAGLTHGAFYSHFKNKGELARAAFVEALSTNRESWAGKPSNSTWSERLSDLSERYLTSVHRDNLENSCALATLCSEMARGDSEFKKTYEAELCKTLNAVLRTDPADHSQEELSDALAFMALIVGSMTLARAVDSEQLSDAILEAGKTHAAKLAK